MITTAIIYNIGRGLAFNVVLPLWYVFNQIMPVGTALNISIKTNRKTS